MRGPLTPALQLWLLDPTGMYAPLWPSQKSVFPTAVKEWSSGTRSHPYQSAASARWGSQQAALTADLWQTGRRKGELPPWQGGSLESCPGAGKGDQVLEEKTPKSQLRGCRQLLPTREVIYCSEMPPSLFPVLLKQPHWAIATLFPGFHRCEHPMTLLPPRALTVGMASQPHGGAPCPGEPGVGCQVRSRVCRPAPGARQGWASRHHEVGVQTIRGAAGGVYSGKICQLLAFSGDGGGKKERVREDPSDGGAQEHGPACRTSVCKPGSVTQGEL